MVARFWGWVPVCVSMGFLLGFGGLLVGFAGFVRWFQWSFSVGFRVYFFGGFFWWSQLGFGGFRGFRFPGGFLWAFCWVIGVCWRAFWWFQWEQQGPKLAWVQGGFSARFWGVCWKVFGFSWV